MDDYPPSSVGAEERTRCPRCGMVILLSQNGQNPAGQVEPDTAVLETMGHRHTEQYWTPRIVRTKEH